jgi:hypothetical protein
VQVQFRGGSIATGRLALRADTVSLYTYYGSWLSFSVDSVTRIWRPGPDHHAAGAKTGAIAGASLGAFAFVAIASAFCSDPDSSSSGCTVGGLTLAAAFGGLIGSAIGVVLGTIIGALAPSWQPVYPTPSGL